MRSNSKRLILSLLVILFIGSVSGQFYHDQPKVIYSEKFLSESTIPLNQSIFPDSNFDKGIDFFDEHINYQMPVSVRLDNSDYARSSVLILDKDKNQIYNSNEDLLVNLSRTNRIEGELYNYGLFSDPFEKNESGVFTIYVLPSIPEDNTSLRSLPSNSISVESEPPVVLDHNLSTEGTNFTYSFVTSEKINEAFVAVNLNYSDRDNIFYHKMMLNDFQRLPNNRYESNFTVDYDGNYSVEIRRVSDKHGNIADHPQTRKVTKIAPPEITYLKPNLSQNISLSDDLVFTIFDRGGKLEEDSLKINISSKNRLLIRDLNQESEAISYNKNDLTLELGKFNLENDLESITFDIYMEDINGKSSNETITYNVAQDVQNSINQKSSFSWITKRLELFLNLF